jgi:acyl-coenzyme A synthetase/AMP-(fatty) acid ligase
MNLLPLLPAGVADAGLATRDGRAVSRDEFLRDVLVLADRLPPIAHVLNVCRDRYWFAVALFAAIAREICTHLPGSAAPEAIAELCTDLAEVACLGDQPQAPSAAVPYLRVSDHEAGAPGPARPMPSIRADLPVVTVFTSGSTGRPRPHRKTFGRLVRNSQAEAAIMWGAAGGPCSVVGTVPSQHMYGLESTVLLPIFGGGRLSSRIPFFPADICQALEEMPEPRLLVMTPFHLRKLLDAEVDIPPVAAVVCSTAALPRALADEVENRVRAPLVEIYGSTETGQLASRRPVSCLEWETYADIALAQQRGMTTADGGHLEQPYVLNDAVELLSPTRFRLLGRNSDMVNIAGKRSSLGYLNHILLSVPGVEDGAFCMPEEHDAVGEVSRLAAFVVAPRLSSRQILDALRAHVDPLFLPRPVVFVDALPRNPTGKLLAADMAALIARHFPPRP